MALVWEGLNTELVTHLFHSTREKCAVLERPVLTPTIHSDTPPPAQQPAHSPPIHGADTPPCTLWSEFRFYYISYVVCERVTIEEELFQGTFLEGACVGHSLL